MHDFRQSTRTHLRRFLFRKQQTENQIFKSVLRALRVSVVNDYELRETRSRSIPSSAVHNAFAADSAAFSARVAEASSATSLLSRSFQTCEWRTSAVVCRVK